MTDLKITQLTADTAPTSDDLVVLVNDPAGTPGNKKATLANLATALAGMIGVYADYTPTFTQSGTLTTSSLVARWVQIGKKVHYWGMATMSSAGTGNNAITVSLPVAPHASGNGVPIGSGLVQDTGTGVYYSTCRALTAGGGTLDFHDPNAGNVSSSVGVTPNFAIASGDLIRWGVIYEAA